jgi:hypothetical protein
MEVSTEKRVAAGMRGASWNAALLPAGMRSSVYALQTSDGAQVTGCLYGCGTERAVVVIAHPRELLLTHYMVPHLVSGGYACWIQGMRSVGNDVRLEHESAVLDVAAGLEQLRALNFEHIVLLGNSGGAALFAFYNQQSLLAPEKRLTHTPAGRPTKLAAAELPVADAFIFIAPHPGQGVLLQSAIDPSVVDESDPLAIDDALSPFSSENGYQPAEAGGAHYAQSFITRYRAAQRDRVARLDTVARAAIARRQAARKAAAADAPAAEALIAAYQPIFQVWRTDADLRCFDLTLDPSERKWGSVWGANPPASNLGSVGFARTCTPESWLSTWSAISSNASFARCGAAVEQPVLLIEYTGDNSVFPADITAIFAGFRRTDAARRRVRGNHHGHPLSPGERSGQDIAGDYARDWLAERFAPAALQVV